jgi:hypothetical protein
MSFRSGLAIVATTAIAALAAMSTMTRAADMITDPRAYCDHAVELLANGNIDELTGDLLEHSNGSTLEVEFKAAVAGFAALPIKAGPLRLHEHASEWKAGAAFIRHYYVLIYQYTPFFLRCTMYRPDRSWLLFDFIGNADPEKIDFRQ